MGREVRRRGRRRVAAAKEKNKNWFMKLKMWQRVLLCTVGVCGSNLCRSKVGKDPDAGY